MKSDIKVITVIKASYQDLLQHSAFLKLTVPNFLRVYGESHRYSHVFCYWLAFLSFRHVVGWLPDDMKALDLRKLNSRLKRYHKLTIINLKDLENMSTKNWVMNNLTREQESALDAEYPTDETLAVWLDEMLRKDSSVALTYDVKNKLYVTYINQGDYALSGRSDNPLDSLVVALYKALLCNWSLSTASVESSNRPRRG